MRHRRSVHVGYGYGSEPQMSEDEAALDWLRREPGFDVRSTLFNETRRPEQDRAVLWMHAPDEPCPLSPEAAETLRRYVEAGGRLLCTGFAAALPHVLGLEDRPAETRPREVADKGFGRPCGFQSFRGHPLLDAFYGGGFLWYADEDHVESRTGYFDDNWPVQGRVVGVEKTYITIHAEARLLTEHEVGDGRIVSAGAFVHFAPKNHLAQHTRRFVGDALRYLMRSEPLSRATFWVPGRNRPCATTVPPGTPLQGDRGKVRTEEGTIRALVPSSAHTILRSPPPAPCTLTREVATDAFFDVAGRRCVMMGYERGGLAEVWTHPFRVLRDLDIGILKDDGIRWLREVPARFEIRPEAAQRTYHLPDGGKLVETIFAAHDLPGGLLRLEAEGAAFDLAVRFRTDFRWMWPYAEDALGSLYYGYDEGLNALHVRDRSGNFYALIGADHAPTDQLGGAYKAITWGGDGLQGTPGDAHEVRQAFQYSLASGSALHLAIAGTNQGREEAEATYRGLLEAPGAVYSKAAKHFDELLTRATMVTTPDTAFNEGYRWAIVGTDRFQATTPGLGTGLLAGYATSADGWDGGHAESGRPGYAWYFGRDAQWAGFAVDAYGDAEAVRRQLELFQTHQDLSGKIFHELPLSGTVHYDAADATPLYLILAAHYVRASGDLDGLRDLWPSIRRALDFLYATDTDGDGLIENTNVGHGWIEGGALFGAHVTLYLAGCWAFALHSMAYLAELMDEPDLAGQCSRDAGRVTEIIERDFWNEEAGFYHYGLRRDGTMNPEPTVLPTVPMYFGLLEPERTGMMLDAYASNAFTADWGVRILGTGSPLFNPKGYHYGSVWPLFTGWTALAEYAYGRPVAGFTHVMQNLLLYRHDALGFVPEVLHGETFTVQRVCPHQCWSETNVLHPILEGLVGFHPDVPHRTLRLEPRPPIHWDTLRVNNLRAGASRIQFDMERTATRTTYRFRLAHGPAVTVHFAPDVPCLMQITGLQIDGEAQPYGQRSPLGLLEPAISFWLSGDVVVGFHHTGGIGMVPHVPEPRPGERSQGFRIIREARDGSTYVVLLEGPAGTTGHFQTRRFDRPIARIDGAEVVATSDDGLTTFAVSFPQHDAPYIRQSVRFQLA